MSDRRPEKLYDPKAATFWWNAEGKHLSITELYEAVIDPVAAVRRGVESGTIEGEVVEVSRMEADASGRVLLVTDQAGTFIVIGPVSDGGSET